MEEVRDRIVTEMMRVNNENRSILEKVRDEKRDFTGEEFQEFSRRNTDLDELEGRLAEVDKQIKSSKQLDEYRANAERIVRPTAVEDENGEGSLEKRVLAWARGEGPRELDISLKGLKVERDQRTGRNVVTESRTGLVEGTTTAGGFTVPTSFRRVLYEHLILNSAVLQTRATVLNTSSGEALLMPKTTAHPAAGTILAEGAVINENDPAFGQGTLSAYKYANLVQVSSELIQDTAVDLLGYLAMAMGRALGLGAGHDYVLGTGSSQPQGLIPGSGTVAQVAGGTGQSGVPTYAELEKIYDAIIPPYQANAEWLFSQFTVAKFRQITDTLGRPLWLPGLSSEMPNQLFGKPYHLDPYMPNAGTSGTSVLFGDFAAYFIRLVDGLRFERSQDFAFNKDLVTFRAIIRTDGLLLDQTGAIANYKGGTA